MESPIKSICNSYTEQQHVRASKNLQHQDAWTGVVKKFLVPCDSATPRIPNPRDLGGLLSRLPLKG